MVLIVCTPSVPSDSVESCFSNASICIATAALRSRSCSRLWSSAFFSSIRATNAGDGPAGPFGLSREPAPGMRVESDRVGKDMVVIAIGSVENHGNVR